MVEAKPTRTQLSDVLYMYTTKVEDPLSFTYEIECTTFKACNVTLNFEGSENFLVEGCNISEYKLNATIRPFKKFKLGKISLIDEDQRASLKMGCEWIMEDPDEKETIEYMKTHEFKINQVLKDAEALNFPPHFDDIDNKKAKAMCANYGKSFVDLEFPPAIPSLYKINNNDNNNNDPNGEHAMMKIAKKTPVEWKRPCDIFDGPYSVIDGIDPNDIRQGALGDCWFLCAIAALTEFPMLVEKIFPEESRQVSEYGIYSLKICKNGWWQDVRVDDYFPCFPGAGPIYSRANGNELWVLLLEKAFAKLHGSYEAIKAGWAYEAMMDLTGAPYKTIRFDDSELKPKIDNGQLWAELMRFDQENYIMSASTPGEDVYTETGQKPKEGGTGLVAGHAYTLISVKQSSKGDKLMKLRNPWGSMEWTGDWSDDSPLWTEQMQVCVNAAAVVVVVVAVAVAVVVTVLLLYNINIFKHVIIFFS
jgi:calpain-15